MSMRSHCAARSLGSAGPGPRLCVSRAAAACGPATAPIGAARQRPATRPSGARARRRAERDATELEVSHTLNWPKRLRPCGTKSHAVLDEQQLRAHADDVLPVEPHPALANLEQTEESMCRARSIGRLVPLLRDAASLLRALLRATEFAVSSPAASATCPARSVAPARAVRPRSPCRSRAPCAAGSFPSATPRFLRAATAC